MTRRLRYLPETTSMVEVTNRTIGSMFLLKPSKKLEKVITGIIGRGQRMYPVLIHSPCHGIPRTTWEIRSDSA